MRANGRKVKRVRASMCAGNPEHARFIFTPLIGPCVAMMKRDLRSWVDEKAKGGGEMSAEMCV